MARSTRLEKGQVGRTEIGERAERAAPVQRERPVQCAVVDVGDARLQMHAARMRRRPHAGQLLRLLRAGRLLVPVNVEYRDRVGHVGRRTGGDLAARAGHSEGEGHR